MKKLNDILNKIKSNIYVQYVILSLFTVFVTECFSRRSILKSLKFAFADFEIFLVGFFIVLTFESLFHLAKKRNYYKFLIPLIWIILSVVSFIMYYCRMLPFTFNDLLLLPTTFTIFPKYITLYQIAILIFVIALLIFLVVKLYRHTPCVKIRFKKDVIFPALVILISVIYIVFARQTHIVDKKISGLAVKYEKNGFVYCFSSSAFERGMNEPDEYSKYEVSAIVKDVNKSDSSKGKDVNIIFLQLESFFDVNNFDGIEYSENPVPNFTHLKENYSRGYLTVPTFSAGTANTEFEVISGMSVDFLGIGEVPYRTILKSKPVDSVCHILKNQGYTTHAIHNNTASFYSRNETYKNLGFDTFTAIEYMNGVEYNSLGWAKDNVLISSIKDCLDSSKNKDLIYAVSVQAHGSYPASFELEPGMIDTTGIDDEVTEAKFEYYINQVKEVDTFLGELLEVLENRNEPVVLVLFGDHLPGFHIEDEDLINQNKYQTEYVIWSNFPTYYTVKDLNSYQLYSYVLDRLNIEGTTLSKLHSQYEYTVNDQYRKKLEIIQYDLLEGDGISYVKHLPSSTKMKMGVRDIKVKSAALSGESLTVKGENFTPFSKVLIANKIFETEFIDTKTLTVSEIQKEDLSQKISVGQVSDIDEIFSVSNEIEIK